MPRFTSLLRTLADSKARYVVVGGVAVVLQGHGRMTVDVDVAIDLQTSNAEAIIKALLEAGLVPSMPVDAADFLDPNARQRWITDKNMRVFSMHDPADPLRRIDLFVEDPIPFEQLWSHSQTLKVDDFQVRVASIEDLIQMKRLAGRVQDLEDIEALVAIQSKRGQK